MINILNTASKQSFLSKKGAFENLFWIYSAFSWGVFSRKNGRKNRKETQGKRIIKERNKFKTGSDIPTHKAMLYVTKYIFLKNRGNGKDFGMAYSSGRNYTPFLLKLHAISTRTTHSTDKKCVQFLQSTSNELRNYFSNRLLNQGICPIFARD